VAAQQWRDQADEQHAERREAVGEFSDDVSRRAQEQREEVQQEASQRHEQAERNARRRKARAREEVNQTQEGLRKRERADKLATARDREAALESEIAAVGAEETVLDLDDRIERSRDARRARRTS
jgi:hypothetical protein